MPDVESAECRTCYGQGRCQWCLGSGERRYFTNAVSFLADSVLLPGPSEGPVIEPCPECAPGIPGRCRTCMGTGTRPDEAA